MLENDKSHETTIWMICLIFSIREGARYIVDYVLFVCKHEMLKLQHRYAFPSSDKLIVYNLLRFKLI